MIIATTSKNRTVNVGSSSFLLCFYSTITKHLVSPATEVPKAYELLKSGKVAANDCLQAARELSQVREILSNISPDQVVWDISNPDKLPPWGGDISPTITSLGNYFVTADGKDLFSELIELLHFASESGESVEVS